MKMTPNLLLTGVFALCACNNVESAKKIQGPFKTQKEKVSYSIGLDIGKNFKQQGMDINLDIMRQGIADAQSGAKPIMNDSQVQVAMQDFQKEMMMKQDSVNRKKGEENKKAGEDFLAKNAKAEGVKVTASGLQYKVVSSGPGKVSPKITDTVTVHYTGTLLDGTEFDSSVKRGQPATFPVGGVIKGWTEALQLMHQGDKFKLFIPPELAYGEHGAGSQIAPNSVLTFDVELLGIKAGK